MHAGLVSLHRRHFADPINFLGSARFFRDSTGNEVDLLYPLGPDFLPVEIKAGQTVSQDWFRGVKTFKKVRADKGPPGLIVYGGKEVQRRSDATVVSLGTMGREIRKLEMES